jgi:hypothetical protein
VTDTPIRAPRTARKSANQPGAASVPKADQPTKPVAVPEGHCPTVSRAKAQAIADASTAAGFPVPPQVAAVLAQPTEDQPAPDAPAAGDGELKTEA